MDNFSPAKEHNRDVEENKLLDTIDWNYDPKKRSITDQDWNAQNKQWDKAKNRWFKEVVNGVIWNDKVNIDDLLSSQKPTYMYSDEYGGEDHADSIISAIAPSDNTTAFTEVEKAKPETVSESGASASNMSLNEAQEILETIVDDANVLDARAVPQPFLKKQLVRYLEDWDKGSAGKRDKIIWQFIKNYTWKQPLDVESLFCCGGSLIFIRFTVGLQMAYMKKQRVPHYFLAIKIFIRSLQGAEYTLQFASMGAIKYIFEIVRVAETVEYDKKQALKFLLELMEGPNGPGVKSFICSVPHYLESMADFLTMCHNTSIIFQCRKVFETLCLGNTLNNVSLVTKYVMAMLPCDFNPNIQALSFRVLQGIVRIIPEMAKLCLKPLQDNLKTEDQGLIVEMGELILVIMDTPEADALIDVLIASATGIRLKEQFFSWDRNYTYRPFTGGRKKLKYKSKLQTSTRDDWEKSMAKKNRKDNYHQQAGAIYILNHLIRNCPYVIDKLINHGILGISLKALGSTPHWQVQTQGLKLVQLLNDLSSDCAMSYFIMMPQGIMDSVIDIGEKCLQKLTPPICLYLRKLGRLTLTMWNDWLQNIVIPAKATFKGTKTFNRHNPIAKKVQEIYLELCKLWESPLMEAAKHKFIEIDEDFEVPIDETTSLKGIVSNDEQLTKLGRQQILTDPKLDCFKHYLDIHNKIQEEHDDILDSRVDEQFLALSHAHNDKDLGGIEMARLLDAESKILNMEEDQMLGEEEEDVIDRGPTVSNSDDFKI